MLDWVDIILRLGAAMLIGSMIGLNRDLQHQPAGMRTHGLVALGSALAVLAVVLDPRADVSRVIQGIITGVGFLGAGVILHRPTGGQVPAGVILRRPMSGQVHGLTTAATIWVTASLGVLCGLAAWPILTIAFFIILLLLIAGGPVEKWLHRHLSSVDKWLHRHLGSAERWRH
jgi:putative Mg2+ transporter-C (MgtC) family protein